MILWVILKVRHAAARGAGSWWGAISLFVYAFAFSYAYVNLDAGGGALILFGAVQLTMLANGFFNGERMVARQIFGLILAIAGLVILLLPGSSAPPMSSALLMLGSGVAWGIYSIW